MTVAKERLRTLRRTNGLCVHCGEAVKKNRKSCQSCLDKNTFNQKNRATAIAEYVKRNKQRLLAIAFDYYGRRCVCCGESKEIFLEFHHVNGDGAVHRAKDKSASSLGVWMARHNFPLEWKVEVLCANCHTAITKSGTCPHKEV